MSVRISPETLSKEVQKMMTEYRERVGLTVHQTVEAVAQETKEAIKAAAPVGSGKRRRRRRRGTYRRSWSVKKTHEDANRSAYTVYAGGKEYTLAHLLENGHALRRGGRTIGQVGARVHIAPADKIAAENLIKRLGDAL